MDRSSTDLNIINAASRCGLMYAILDFRASSFEMRPKDCQTDHAFPESMDQKFQSCYVSQIAVESSGITANPLTDKFPLSGRVDQWSSEISRSTSA